MSSKGQNDKWEFYQDDDPRKRKWRWRRTAPNGRIVGASTQGYSDLSDCLSNAERNGFNATE
ncbi:DUF1508 domain-containing protein [Sneathiella chinensis]|uniref:DUF1508 domain-containing protein n=1 Tax=Sneathiella chinensis TaxID=349750 RepID=A0ABQ5U047_9PROT|nr:DUF1508 domain-containing protein [Sneathiella chinensis]GLQ05505.1 DUF1508 domain-containing protein [Sneathiella chinensis]